MITHAPTLELRDVVFAYPRLGGAAKERVLEGVNLKVMPGEGLAVVGPSGCGKSTLLEIMATLLAPEAGAVIYGGREITSLADDERCRFRNQDLGFIFQNHRLLPQCTALENVLLPTLPNPNREPPEAEQRRALEILERVGLTDRRRHRPDELSMGQRQRVAVARALMNRPGILLADEPTGALDQKNSEALLELLSELRREMELTMVLVTHAPAIAKSMDRVVTLRDGRLQDL